VIPLALCHVGNRHTGTSTKGHTSSQIPSNGYRLLHQVDRGKTTARNYDQWGGEVHLPYAIVTNNDTQFKAQTYEDFLTRLGVKHLVTSVEHPQTNGQAQTSNRVILKALGTWLDKSKSLWKEELPSILWAYHCSPQTATNETPYRPIYGTNAMIPVEFGERSTRRLLFQQQKNEENTRVEL